ncbi:MAG TPA: aminomethyl-transferring glycine dehydrogenase [Candidatus Paceibacterota bacterium]|nr:aminomethyl-transferring glycine dehydrogenase [Verrucomicrobiota bacterium]HSA12201.1 aminomethyl-transferring glycine dehydrogenase [Candidatus Paceibacterota bacterium]
MPVAEALNNTSTTSRNIEVTNTTGTTGLLHPHNQFPRRHIGPSSEEAVEMLKLLGFTSLEALVDEAVPSQIRLRQPLQLPAARGEQEVLTALKDIASLNQVFRSYIGMGYADCVTPAVIQRNLLENPGWYTPYTPYQAEIAQGRLEALLNFQTLVTDLTGLDVANASLLDEATAAAEAMTLCHSLKPGRSTFFVSAECHPQTIEVVKTRAAALGNVVVVGDHQTFRFDAQVFGALVQYPTTYGEVFDYSGFIEQAHAAGALVAVTADLLSLTLLRPPGEFGADVALGSAQRLGVPLGYGGPHAAYFATRDAFMRRMPGRMVGVSKDTRGRPALRLALQTREQHIRREKATSNICTAQALLASMAAIYACYHGPAGLRQIAQRIHALALALAGGLKRLGYEVGPKTFFDTIRVALGEQKAADILKVAETRRMNFRVIDEHTIGIALDETTTLKDLADILMVFNENRPPDFSVDELATAIEPDYPAPFARTSGYLANPVFNRYHSETELMRYIKRLESRDLSLTTSMIPLGSCTMKLNAACEMFPVTWPELARLHPFAPLRQTRGYQILFQQLEEWLAEITGFAGISLQPNAGAQGEYTGLLVIRAWHLNRCEGHRDVCLIPTSAHGTNPASAVMAGLKVVPVNCDSNGNIDVADLRAKAEAHKTSLAALMVTYPSTHGVFEQAIREICEIIHANGGQVYMDGANLNAQVGLCRPRDIGADVCHVNLHKTFCIPHGGGGPGMGPIGVAEHLVEFLPGHSVVPLGGENPIGAVAAAPWGSASILPIPWVYIAAMGAHGLTKATQYAILNANYIARRLQDYFPVLYRGHGNLVAHECILDLRQFKDVTVEDVAKRLMDYGFHAPTISWPVPGTMMVEPTESESKEELDRFCDALISIHAEITAIQSGQADKQNNLLKNAPHTADMIAADSWPHPYSRQQAAFPAKWLYEHKFWPAVGRIDNVYGDRNPICTCAGMETYTSKPATPGN